jgi:hypothetical protein
MSWLVIAEEAPARCWKAPGAAAGRFSSAGRTAASAARWPEQREAVVEVESRKRIEESSRRADPHRAGRGRRSPNRRGARRSARRRCSIDAPAACCRRCTCSPKPATMPTCPRRDAGIHLAPDRAQARRLRRRGQGAGRLSRPGHHPLRDRAGGRRQGQPDREPGEGPGARPLAGVDPRGRDDPGQVLHGRWNCPTRSGRSCACRRSSAPRPTTACIRR